MPPGPSDDIHTPDLSELDHGTITVEQDVLVLVGEVDTVLVQAWRKDAPLPSTIRAVQASEVTFFGSAGLGLLVELNRLAGPHRLALRGPTRPVLRAIEVTGLASVLDVVADG